MSTGDSHGVVHHEQYLAFSVMLAVATSTFSSAKAHGFHEDPGMGALPGDDQSHLQLTSITREHKQHADREGAGDKRAQTKGIRSHDGVDQEVQAVPTTADPGQPGDGCLYFSHPAVDRSVVIGANSSR